MTDHPQTAIAKQHQEMRAIYQWPLFVFGNDDDGGRVECDYCAVTLANSFEPLNLDILYRAVSQHRLDGCPNAPAQG